MRILVLHREYPPETGWGGIATFNFHLAHGLVALGHEVDVLSFSYRTPSDGMVDGVRVRRIVSPLPRLPWEGSLARYFWEYQKGVYQAFREMSAERVYDVVDTADHLAEGLSIIRSGEVPTTLRFYSPWSWVSSQSLNLAEARYDVLAVKWMERASARGADVLTCPSQDLADRVDAFFRLDRPIDIIPNPIDVDTFRPPPSRDNAPLVVKFLGRWERRKGPDTLLEAIPQVVEALGRDAVRFVYIGRDSATSTQPSFHAEAQAFLAARGLSDLVEFRGQVPLSELPAQYCEADIVVVPSRYDTSPYVCQEAMACGCAIVGSTAGGMPEYLDFGRAGLLVPPDNPALLARSVIRLARDPALRAELGQAARDRTVSLYRRDVIAMRMAELYHRAIAVNGLRKCR